MKKILTFFSLFLLLVIPCSAFASSPFVSDSTTSSDGKKVTAPSGFERFIGTPPGVDAPAGLETTLPTAIGGIINLLLGAVGVIMMIIVIWAGYIWLTAGGNETKVQQARKMISRAAIGLVLALSAFAISSYVVGVFERTIFDTGTKTETPAAK